MKAMRELRAENIQKRARDSGNATYCICRRGSSGFMLQCELCKDWFHGKKDCPSELEVQKVLQHGMTSRNMQLNTA